MRVSDRFLFNRLAAIALALAAAPLSTAALQIDLPEACAPDSDRLSPLARQVFDRIRSAGSLEESTVPEDLLLTHCNRLEEVFVDGPEIFGGMRDAIAGARHEVALAFLKWEDGSHAANLIGEGLKLAAANPERGGKLLVRILINDSQIPLSGRTINHLYDSAKDWQLDEEEITLQLGTYPHTLQGVLHDKYLVVDGNALIVTGANVEAVHDPPLPWHDTGYLLSGAVAASALASFDEAWDHHAEHWSCSPQTLSFDCDQTTHDAPDRPWLSAIDFGDGSVPMIVTTREAKGHVNNGIENPQDLAWQAVMDGARRNLHIATPNINDDAFRDAVVAAAARGVEVRLITGKGFNKSAENIPSQGGFNREVVGKLRQRMRRDHPLRAGNLKICWYSEDGVRPVVGNGEGASHTKFLSVDGRIAVVGSGNMDTQSWNHSRELNVLIDDPDAVARIEGAYFTEDWERATCQLVEFWEGNGGSQDLTCSLGALHNQTVSFSDDSLCVDDEARSLTLREVPAGRVFRLFDSPNGRREDDWLEIRTKRPIRERTLSTLESSFEDADLRVIYHRNNGLDGKVSLYQASSAPSGATLDLYESTNARQNLLCSIDARRDRTVNFQRHSQCDNDEAQSLVLYDLPAGRVIRLFDAPDGRREDDWLEIQVKRAVARKVISRFERSFEDDDVRAIYHRNDGLSGKVSRLVVSSRATGPTADLYEGGGGSQNLVCSVEVGRNQRIDFTRHSQCDNDEARSLRLYDVPAGRALLLFDSPSGSREDDWIAIRTKRPILDKRISSFERSFEDDDVAVTFFRNNGLNGKVSRLEITRASALRPVLSFYEGTGGSQNKVCELSVRTGTINFKKHRQCDNDEAKSLVLSFVRAGTVVRVYDDPSCRTNDDWAEIEVKQDAGRLLVSTFERDRRSRQLDVTFHRDNGLNGKVSCVKIFAPRPTAPPPRR